MTLAALPVHVALVDQTNEIGFSNLQNYAAALSEQVARDFAPTWHAPASIQAYQGKPPTGTWAVYVKPSLDQPGALGYHTDNHNQPVAYVEYTGTWDVTVSHETLEMLADPFGNRMHGGRLPMGVEDRYSEVGLTSAIGTVAYLLEVCDPPESEQFSYQVGNFQVSDFIRPVWYSNTSTGKFAPPHVYSHNGGCQNPREVADGGYCSFANPKSAEWFQVFNQSGTLQLNSLGTFDKSKHGSIREFTDAAAREYHSN